jgi:NAD(P)-dependent dehydrogenase (short-subunit alcohol dehydrogenase family)
MEIEGTIAVVTGGASGIGRATALELAQIGLLPTPPNLASSPEG